MIADVIVSLGPVPTTIPHQAMIPVDIEDAIAEWASSLHRHEGGLTCLRMDVLQSRGSMWSPVCGDGVL